MEARRDTRPAQALLMSIVERAPVRFAHQYKGALDTAHEQFHVLAQRTTAAAKDRYLAMFSSALELVSSASGPSSPKYNQALQVVQSLQAVLRWDVNELYGNFMLDPMGISALNCWRLEVTAKAGTWHAAIASMASLGGTAVAAHGGSRLMECIDGITATADDLLITPDCPWEHGGPCDDTSTVSTTPRVCAAWRAACKACATAIMGHSVAALEDSSFIEVLAAARRLDGASAVVWASELDAACSTVIDRAALASARSVVVAVTRIRKCFAICNLRLWRVCADLDADDEQDVAPAGGAVDAETQAATDDVAASHAVAEGSAASHPAAEGAAGAKP